MAKKFPKTMYVKISDGGTGPDYFDASESKLGMVETGETTRVAVYKLVGMEEVRGIVAVKKLPMPK